MSAVTTIDLRKKTDVPAQATHQELTTPKLSPIELSKTLGRIFRRWDDPAHPLFSSSEELRHFRKNVARYAWRRHKKKVTRAQARAQSAPSTKPSRARHNELSSSLVYGGQKEGWRILLIDHARSQPA